MAADSVNYISPTITSNGLQARWYQEEAVDALFAYFAEHGGSNLDGSPIRANPLLLLPTGTGKSVIIAKFLQRAFAAYPGTRALMVTHVKELIEQNAKRLQFGWPLAPLGIHSAGLKQTDFVQPIIFGGVKSMVGKLDDQGRSIFGFRDFIIVDEAHLIPTRGEAEYVQLLLELMAINPFLKVIGLSATGYRLGLGHLTNGNLFTDVAYDLCNMEGFRRLIAEGYLAPLIAKDTENKIDISNVGLSSTGDYNDAQLQAAVDDNQLTHQTCGELVRKGMQRRAWAVFASGIKHAEDIAETLRCTYGVPAVEVHSKMSNAERDARIKSFKRGEVRCIVNKDILTTGWDFPPLDLIAVKRPTTSTGLWVQMLGRETRPFDWYKLSSDMQDEWSAFGGFVKGNGLVLDFAGNTPRLGPIDDPVIPRMKGKGKPGDAPVKICQKCGGYNHSSRRECEQCGDTFPIAERGPNIAETAGTDEVMRSDLPLVETFDVLRQVCVPHKTRKGENYIKVSYYCSGPGVPRTFFEYITLEGEGYKRKVGRDWFRQRVPVADVEPPETNAEVTNHSEFLRTPRAIRVWVNRKDHPQVMSYEF